LSAAFVVEVGFLFAGNVYAVFGLDDEAALVVDETIEGAVVHQVGKRRMLNAEERWQMLEAPLVPGALIARVAREHGVNGNQVFQWRYEYRKQTSKVS
jgi:hypothetical protein